MMHSTTSVSLRSFFGAALTMFVLLVALGWVVTSSLDDSGAAQADMLAGCTIALIGSLIGAVPFVWAQRRVFSAAEARDGVPEGKMPVRNIPVADALARNTVSIVLAALGLRLMVVLVLATSAAMSGWFAPTPLLLWVVIGHVGLLIVDTRHATRVLTHRA
jgi:hypothetical protein